MVYRSQLIPILFIICSVVLGGCGGSSPKVRDGAAKGDQRDMSAVDCGNCDLRATGETPDVAETHDSLSPPDAKRPPGPPDDAQHGDDASSLADLADTIADPADMAPSGDAAACVAGQTTCEGKDLLQCAPDGSRWVLWLTCDCGCVDAPGGASCEPPTCAPGSQRCVQGNLERCDALGCAFETVSSCGVGCPPGESCLTCQPGARRCDAKGVHEERCSSDGTSWMPTACPYGCDATLGRCRACIPKQLRCSADGTILQRCADDGQSFSDEPCADGCTSSDGAARCRQLISKFDAVFAGANWTCAILSADQSLLCWDGWSGLVSVPGPWKSGAIAGAVLYAIKGDDTLWSGSLASAPKSVTPKDDQTWRRVDAVDELVCALRWDWSVWCRGHGNTWWSPKEWTRLGGEGDLWLTISIGYSGSYSVGCAIRRLDQTALGTLDCWGSNWSGQLGIGDRETAPFVTCPTMVGSPDDRWRDVSVGAALSCGIKADNSLWCWGTISASSSAPPADALFYADTPIQVSKGPWKSVVVGNRVACAIRTDGSVGCWGNDLLSGSGLNVGEMYLGFLPSITPVSAPTGWLQLSAGADHWCGVQSDKSLHCWGANRHYQATRKPVATSSKPLMASTVSTKMVATSWTSSCVVDTRERLWCWGLAGSTPGVYAIGPVQVAPSTSWTTVVAGGYHHCALTSDKKLWCWGVNTAGELGIGSTVAQTKPQLVAPPAVEWRSAHLGAGVSCGIRDDGTLWCWGKEAQVQHLLQSGVITDATRPVQLPFGGEWRLVSPGPGFSCGITIDGRAWCWGGNGDGQLGDGSITDSVVPRPVSGEGTWLAVAVGYSHACGIKTGGGLWCWGLHKSYWAGYLGISTAQLDLLKGMDNWYSDVPLRIGEQKWLDVQVRGARSCALRQDGELHCWERGEPQRHLLTGTTSTEPGWEQMAISTGHVCALSGNGILWCRGSNYYCQLGAVPCGWHLLPQPIVLEQ